VEDLGSSNGTFINNQPVPSSTRSVLKAQTYIAAGGIVLTATPEFGGGAIAPPASYAPSNPSSSISPPSTSGLGSPSMIDSGFNPLMEKYRIKNQDSPHSNFDASSYSKAVSWSAFVKDQANFVNVQNQMSSFGNAYAEDFLSAFGTWYSLTTGFRNHPWIGNGDNRSKMFDGYVIPNFSMSAATISKPVERAIDQLKNYEDTDCCTVRLTDAHLADSATQSYAGIEFSPVQRGDGENRRADFREFCVTSYHRVRNYLLVEKYGDDVFISWVTRFEPRTSHSTVIPLAIVAYFVLAIVLSSFAKSGQVFLGTMLGCATAYGITPCLMSVFDVLPKKSNAQFISTVINLFFALILFGSLVATASQQGDSSQAVIALFTVMMAIAMGLGGTTALLLFTFPYGLIFYKLFLQPKLGQEYDIPPFDRLDARKLDDMVAKQVSDTLKPILQECGYAEEQIQNILTRTSIGQKVFQK
jgi:hypothetical protein